MWKLGTGSQYEDAPRRRSNCRKDGTTGAKHNSYTRGYYVRFKAFLIVPRSFWIFSCSSVMA